jgi:hypothetical protein
MSGTLARALMLLFVLLVAVDSVLGERPTSPVSASAPADAFSAERALGFAHALLPESVPHPVGSEENDRVRERLVNAFAELGLAAKVETGSACNARGRCETVKNVVATLPGTREEALLVSAHYDSVPAGPGVGDDLAGAASVLEIARAMMKSESTRELSVVFLVDDGEEAGLLGARAFIADSPEARTVRWAVNMDNRGDRGPAMMFETSPGNAELVPLFARAAHRPVATSLFYEVYRRMPNDTDFTIWKRAGIKGLNFAFIGGADRYHTSQDDFEHLDPRSVQHEGECALAAARAIAEHPPSADTQADVVYFDLFGAMLATCPARFALPLTLALLLAYLLAATIRVRQEITSLRSLVIENLGWLLALALSVATTLALSQVIHQVPLFGPATTSRAAAFTLVGVSAAALTLGGMRRWVSGGTAHAPWLLFLVLGVVVAAFVPGASYLFFFPGVVVAGSEMVSALGAPREGSVVRDAGSILPLAASAMVWSPVLSGVESALGMAIPAIFSVIGAVMLFPVLAIVRLRGRLLLIAAMTIVAALALLVWTPSVP